MALSLSFHAKAQLRLLAGPLKRQASTSSSSVPSASSKAARSRAGALSTGSKDGKYSLIEKVIASSTTQSKQPDQVADQSGISFDEEQDEVISRAWMLHRHHEREETSDRIKKAALAQWKALDRLKEIKPLLYQVVVSRGSTTGEVVEIRNGGEEMVEKNKAPGGGTAPQTGVRVGGVFPIDLKIPTDTPSRKGWNYGWKP